MGLAENDEMIQALELTLARPQHNHARLLRLKPERRHSGPVRRLNIHISACSRSIPVRRTVALTATRATRAPARHAAAFDLRCRNADRRGAVRRAHHGIPIIRDALDELLDQEREHHKSELLERTRGLELAVVKLESALAALQVTLATERGKAIDLPNPLIN